MSLTTMWCGVLLVIVVAASTYAEDGKICSPLLPKDEECGKRTHKAGRVVWGEDAPLSAFPWMALLGYMDVKDPTWLCGATLINPRYVLTAAHCVDPRIVQLSGIGPVVKIRLGEHNIDTDPDCANFTRGADKECAPPAADFLPEKQMVHENFDIDNLMNDIALIRINSPVKYSSSIRPVCLPPAGMNVEEFLASRGVTVAGWGATQSFSFSKILQKAILFFEGNDVCSEKYLTTLLESQLCFGGKGKVDSCFGDSGGPIMQTRQGTDQYTIVPKVKIHSTQTMFHQCSCMCAMYAYVHLTGKMASLNSW